IMCEQIAAQRPSWGQSSAAPSLPSRTTAEAARRSTIVADSPHSQRLTVSEADDSRCPIATAASDSMEASLRLGTSPRKEQRALKLRLARVGNYSAICRECRGEDCEGDESKDDGEAGRAPACGDPRDATGRRLGSRRVSDADRRESSVPITLATRAVFP